MEGLILSVWSKRIISLGHLTWLPLLSLIKPMKSYIGGMKSMQVLDNRIWPRMTLIRTRTVKLTSAWPPFWSIWRQSRKNVVLVETVRYDRVPYISIDLGDFKPAKEGLRLKVHISGAKWKLLDWAEPLISQKNLHNIHSSILYYFVQLSQSHELGLCPTFWTKFWLLSQVTPDLDANKNWFGSPLAQLNEMIQYLWLARRHKNF